MSGKNLVCPADYTQKGNTCSKTTSNTVTCELIDSSSNANDRKHACYGDNGVIKVDLTDKELLKRKESWKPRTTDYNSGTLWKYSQTVGSAQKGAITHPGADEETHVYADI